MPTSIRGRRHPRRPTVRTLRHLSRSRGRQRVSGVSVGSGVIVGTVVAELGGVTVVPG